jgi:hypothetical protein
MYGQLRNAFLLGTYYVQAKDKVRSREVAEFAAVNGMRLDKSLFASGAVWTDNGDLLQSQLNAVGGARGTKMSAAFLVGDELQTIEDRKNSRAFAPQYTASRVAINQRVSNELKVCRSSILPAQPSLIAVRRLGNCLNETWNGGG